MMQRIVVPTAAVVGTVAAATAAATIALLLSVPNGQAMASSGGNVVLPFLHAVVTMLVDVVWAVLGYL